MFRYTFAALITISCYLYAPLCVCSFNIESLFQEIPELEGVTNFRNSMLSELNNVLPGRKTNSSGDHKKDVPTGSNPVEPSGSVPCELDSSGNEPLLTVTIEKPTSAFPISKQNRQSPQELKLSNLFGLKSIFDNLHNGFSLPRVTQGFTGAGSANKGFQTYRLIDNSLKNPPDDKDISIIVIEDERPTQTTTTTTTTTPTVTTDAGVIAVKENLENCLNKKECDLFNIQGLLWEIFNSKPTSAETTQQPTTTQQTRVPDSQLFPFFSFNNIFSDRVPTTTAPVVEENTAGIPYKNIFEICGIGYSQGDCEPNLFNVLSKIINIKPSDNAPQKNTEALTKSVLDSQLSPVQYVPSQVFRKVFPILDYGQFLPSIAKIYPPVQENQKQPEKNGRVPNLFNVQTLNAAPVVVPDYAQRYNEKNKVGNKIPFDDVEQLLADLNLFK